MGDDAIMADHRASLRGQDFRLLEVRPVASSPRGGSRLNSSWLLQRPAVDEMRYCRTWRSTRSGKTFVASPAGYVITQARVGEHTVTKPVCADSSELGHQRVAAADNQTPAALSAGAAESIQSSLTRGREP
jgi:hypothetical protein